MQRYGIVRIYGRKANDDQGALERWLLVARGRRFFLRVAGWRRRADCKEYSPACRVAA